ncbi:MAG: hypothetical protein ACXWQO_07810 [Bdellovibrionota bacterium]
MKNKFLIPMLLLAGFAGITSCGDNADSSKDAEIAALKARIAAGGGVSATGATVTTTAVATVTVNSTVTNTNTSSNTSVTRQ